MTDLVVCLAGKNSMVNHVSQLIERIDWTQVFLITDEDNQDLVKTQKAVHKVIVDFSRPVGEIINSLTDELKHKVSGTEVALNMVSGGGKEHMAILSSVLRSGVGFRLVALTKDGIVEL